MPRAHWLILAIGVALMLFFSLSPEQRRPVTESLLLEQDRPQAEAEFGEPDLLLDAAVITQFRADGSLQYRLHAERIAHYPMPEQTVLTRPRLLLDQSDAAPWILSAARGRILGGAALFETSEALATRPDAPNEHGETVILEEDVNLRRQRTPERFIDLRTSLLTLYPEREYAETDRPVIIETEAGHTTAASLRADLTAGRISLAGVDDDQVHTTLVPDRLP